MTDDEAFQAICELYARITGVALHEVQDTLEKYGRGRRISGPGGSFSMSMPEQQLQVFLRDDPVRVIKQAKLALNYDPAAPGNVTDAKFARVGAYTTTPENCYRADDVMFCPRHPVPSSHFPGEGCGFYGWKPGMENLMAGSWVLLSADLCGTVVEHKRGFRGTRQRVLAAELPQSPCSRCSCDDEEEPFLDMSNLLHQALTSVTIPLSGKTSGLWTYKVLCGECASRWPHYALPSGRLRELLGTEVTWRKKKKEDHVNV